MVIGPDREMCVSGLKLSRKIINLCPEFLVWLIQEKVEKIQDFLEEGRNELTSSLGSGVHK